jgi:hypothetical protein
MRKLHIAGKSEKAYALTTGDFLKPVLRFRLYWKIAIHLYNMRDLHVYTRLKRDKA